MRKEKKLTKTRCPESLRSFESETFDLSEVSSVDDSEIQINHQSARRGRRSPPGPWTDERLSKSAWLRKYTGGFNSALQAIGGDSLTPAEIAAGLLERAHEAPRPVYSHALHHAAEYAQAQNQPERAAQLRAAAEIIEGMNHE